MEGSCEFAKEYVAYNTIGLAASDSSRSLSTLRSESRVGSLRMDVYYRSLQSRCAWKWFPVDWQSNAPAYRLEPEKHQKKSNGCYSAIGSQLIEKPVVSATANEISGNRIIVAEMVVHD